MSTIAIPAHLEMLASSHDVGHVAPTVRRVNATATRYTFETPNLRLIVVATDSRVTSHKLETLATETSPVANAEPAESIASAPAIVLPTEDNPAIPALVVDVVGRPFVDNWSGEHGGTILSVDPSGASRVAFDHGTLAVLHLAALTVEYSGSIEQAPALLPSHACVPSPAKPRPSIVGRFRAFAASVVSNFLDTVALVTGRPSVVPHPAPVPADYSWLPCCPSSEASRRYVPTCVLAADS